MARKSNKTAHVLNLLSSGQEPEEELEKEAEVPAAKPEPEAAAKTEPAAAGTSGAEAAPAREAASPAAPAVPAASAAPLQPEVPPNISIIDGGAPEEDPVAERIREELLKNLDPEEAKELEAEMHTANPEKEEEPETPAQEVSATETTTAPAQEAPAAETTATPAQEAPATETAAAPAQEAPAAETAAAPAQEVPAAETTAAPEETGETEILELQEEPELPAEPPQKPEPGYVMVNVMQRIVEDKIIYFMKQFEVCTCRRCRMDTIALTLSGLPAKYMVMDRHAVDSMISYLTSRLISQVTVEALKACTQVKEQPRHQPEDEEFS